jgi:uncharacterized protein (UPF0332 family)
MSPRSAEFFDAAQRRLATARQVVDDDPAASLSAAYYAMLYAARAALSESDVYARTHSGIWHKFRRAFVEGGISLAPRSVRRPDSSSRADAHAAPVAGGAM